MSNRINFNNWTTSVMDSFAIVYVGGSVSGDRVNLAAGGGGHGNNKIVSKWLGYPSF